MTRGEETIVVPKDYFDKLVSDVSALSDSLVMMGINPEKLIEFQKDYGSLSPYNAVLLQNVSVTLDEEKMKEKGMKNAKNWQALLEKIRL